MQTILVVNDNVIERYATARVLTSAGYDVREVGSGRQALGFLQQAPALVVLDVALQDLDGFAVCRQFRRHPTGRRVPIVLHTSVYMDPEDERRGYAAGADAYLRAPVDPAQLLDTVKRLLDAGEEDRARRS
jgi:CheY-like chemotaxis protein